MLKNEEINKGDLFEWRADNGQTAEIEVCGETTIDKKPFYLIRLASAFDDEPEPVAEKTFRSRCRRIEAITPPPEDEDDFALETNAPRGSAENSVEYEKQPEYREFSAPHTVPSPADGIVYDAAAKGGNKKTLSTKQQVPRRY